jgi:YidC/Oxa1 family membrane protein insertase
MDQVRLLIAIGLSFIVLFVWSVYFVDQQPVQEPVQNNLENTETTAAKSEPVSNPPEVVNTDSKAMDLPTDENRAPQPANIREIEVQTPYYNVRISSRGGVFTSYVLNAYRETVDPDSPKKQLISEEIKSGILHTSLKEKSIPNIDEAVYRIDVSEDTISVTNEKKYIGLTWSGPDGATVTKIFGFDPSSYLIDMNVIIKNATTNPIRDRIAVSIRNMVTESQGYGFVGPSAYIDNSLEQIKIKKIEDNSENSGKIKWVGVEDRYFLSSIIPEEEIEGSIKLSKQDNIITNQFINPTFNILPGTQKEFKYLIFMGPKSMKLLNQLGHELGKALNFGFFDVLAKPCLWFMNKIHSVVPNYGIAIIILTFFTKIILWPLGTKSYKSMSDMKRLQPLMTDLREKYKDDKQKMNQELMALYRTYKINPMGGCLPMVLQIPVFFALYRMLYQAIELRHAPFFLWINDLSAPDRLFHFDFSIPFMHPPYGIPVLTIIMGATMLLQQKMSPPPGDPTQAKMMMFMPLVFTFIFINFSSGLVLYWLVNNLFSISQQYWVQKKAK